MGFAEYKIDPFVLQVRYIDTGFDEPEPLFMFDDGNGNYIYIKWFELKELFKQLKEDDKEAFDLIVGE